MKNLCLAKPEQVRQVTGSEAGQVSLLNAGIATIIDRRVVELDKVFGKCGVTYYTLEINPQDLAALAQAQIFDFTEPKDKSTEKSLFKLCDKTEKNKKDRANLARLDCRASSLEEYISPLDKLEYLL